MTYRERHLRGRVEIGALIGHWQDGSGLSNVEFAALTEWALGEPSPIHKSTLSHLRNRNYARNASLPVIEALAATNDVIYKWHHGERDALLEAHPLQNSGLTEDDIDNTIWLPRPDDPTTPLSYTDLCLVAVGQLPLPYIGIVLAGDESERLCSELTDLLWSLVADVPARDALTAIVRALPDSPGTRAAVSSLLGGAPWDRAELESRLPELAVGVAVLQGQPPQSITPMDLLAQLTAGRRRT